MDENISTDKCCIMHLCENLPENIHILEGNGYVVRGEFFEHIDDCGSTMTVINSVLQHVSM